MERYNYRQIRKYDSWSLRCGIIYAIGEGFSIFSGAVSEIMDIRDLEYMEQAIDILQLGSRNMYNYSMLKELG